MSFKSYMFLLGTLLSALNVGYALMGQDNFAALGWLTATFFGWLATYQSHRHNP